MNAIPYALDPARQDASAKQTIESLSAYLHREFGRVPVFQPTLNRFESTAWITVVENPQRPLAMQRQMALIPLWIFTVDDLIDGHAWEADELQAHLLHYETIVQGTAARPMLHDPLAKVLWDLCRVLEAGPLYAGLKALWRDSYIKMMRAMLLEAYAPADHVWTYAKYMAGAEFSIGVPTYVLATWIVSADGGFDREADALSRLLRHASRSIRLANDLRTYVKEQGENNGNAVSIMQRAYREQGMDHDQALTQAEQFIRQQLGSEMAEVRNLSEPSPWHQNLRALTEATVGLYEVGDFHTLGSDDLLSARD